MGESSPLKQIQDIEMFEEEREIDFCGTGKTKEHMYIRVLRKKYKCFIIFLLAVIVIFQTIYLLLEKVDDSFVNSLIKKTIMYYKNKTNEIYVNNSSVI